MGPKKFDEPVLGEGRAGVTFMATRRCLRAEKNYQRFLEPQCQTENETGMDFITLKLGDVFREEKSLPNINHKKTRGGGNRKKGESG